MSSPSIYESDTASDERPASQPTRAKIQATFQIAHPPPKSSLRLSAKLLLQIQQLAHRPRPVPVLEVWQPPFRKSKLTRDFYQRPKVRAGDIYATHDEPYITHKSSSRKVSAASDVPGKGDESAQEKDIVAAMCQESSAKTIHFRDARCSWQASAGKAGLAQNIPCYRFTMNSESPDSPDPGRMVFQWEKRSAASNDETPSDTQFVLVVIDRKARRKSRIATMTPDGVEVLVHKSSIMEHLQVCLDLTCPVAAKAAGRDPYENLETWLYTHVLTLGVWVAHEEGWFH
ncbi:hypothetical protein N7492_009266 [Penicillium capsulatum]|uniref:Uncharacterized protein n=1 Tax=Penicillium capsulatum TaxID=69766 RepID=A0A9W9LHQ9_9EURO|nr:hypothetical protein N7492_009266 [Penicillium capsulatum]KAJ6106660.1 hypothetical protein N7512_010177 [Penicillium capsulatum]